MAKISTLVDAFDSQSANWDFTNGGWANAGDGYAHVSMGYVDPATGSGTFNNINSTATWDATASAVSFSYVRPTTGTWGAYFTLRSTPSGNGTDFAINYTNSGVQAGRRVGSTYQGTTATWTPVVGERIRLTEAGGTITLARSTDGGSTYATVTNGTFLTSDVPWWNAVTVSMGGQNFDNVNKELLITDVNSPGGVAGGVNPKIATLNDGFDVANTTVWDFTNGGSVTGSQAHVTAVDQATAFHNISAKTAYDGTASVIGYKLTPATGGTTPQSYFDIWSVTSGTDLSIQYSGGTAVAGLRIGHAYQGTTATWTPTAGEDIRIREAGGTVTVERSTNGGTSWANVSSTGVTFTTQPWWNAVKPAFGGQNSGGTSTDVLVDYVGTPPVGGGTGGGSTGGTTSGMTTQPTWREEFTGTALSLSDGSTARTWTPSERGAGTTEQYTGGGSYSWEYVPSAAGNAPSPWSVTNSILTMRCYRNPGTYTSYPATSGGHAIDWIGGTLTSEKNSGLAWSYGYFEFRARLPVHGKGMFPALWMYKTIGSAGYDTPSVAEFDLMEIFGDDGGPWVTTIHGLTSGGGGLEMARQNTDITDWHRYGVNWDANRIDFYRDGVKYASAPLTWATWFRGASMGIRMDYAANPNFNGNQSDGTTPSTLYMEIDYVRVYSTLPSDLATGNGDPYTVVTTATAPGIPTGVSAVRGNTTATVTWTAPASNGGSPITDYQVSVNNGAYVSTGSTTTSYTKTGLTNGTSYTFTVKAVNAIGASVASAASNAVTPSAVAPGAPTSVAVTRSTADPTQATVTWAAPTSNGGSAVTGYQVAWATGTLSYGPVAVTASPYTITNLGTGSYTVTVVAVNAIGTGTIGSATVTPTSGLETLGAVSDNFNDTALDIEWVVSPGIVQSGGAVQFPTPTATPETIYRRGIATGQRVFMRMFPFNGTGQTTGFFLRSTNARTQRLVIYVRDGVIYAANELGVADPQQAGRVYSTATDIYWSIRHNTTNNTMVLETGVDGVTWNVLTHPTITAPAWLADAEVGVEAYLYSATTPVPPPTGGGTTPPTNVPSAVQSLAASAITTGEATITWNAPASNGGSPIDYYTFTRDGADASGAIGYTTTVTGLTQGLTVLVPNTTYNVTVTPHNANGNGTAAKVTFKTLATTSTPPPATGGAGTTVTVNLGSTLRVIRPTAAGLGCSTFGNLVDSSAVEATAELALDARTVRIPTRWNGSNIVSSAGGNNNRAIENTIKWYYQNTASEFIIVIAGRDNDWDNYVGGDAGAILNRLKTLGIYGDGTRYHFTGPNEPNQTQGMDQVVARSQQILGDLRAAEPGRKMWGPVWTSPGGAAIDFFNRMGGAANIDGIDWHSYPGGGGTNDISVPDAWNNTFGNGNDVANARTSLAGNWPAVRIAVDEFNWSWAQNTSPPVYTSANTVLQAIGYCEIITNGGIAAAYASQNDSLSVLVAGGTWGGQPQSSPTPAYWGIAALTGGGMPGSPRLFPHFNDHCYNVTQTAGDGLTRVYAFNNEAGGFNLVIVNARETATQTVQVNLTGVAAGSYYQFLGRKSNPYDPPVKTGPFTYTTGISIAMGAQCVAVLQLIPGA